MTARPGCLISGQLADTCQEIKFIFESGIWTGNGLQLYNTLKDKRPIGRFLLALTEGPMGPQVRMVTDRVLTVL